MARFNLDGKMFEVNDRAVMGAIVSQVNCRGPFANGDMNVQVPGKIIRVNFTEPHSPVVLDHGQAVRGLVDVDIEATQVVGNS